MKSSGTVLVTGALGYIGSVLTSYLTRQGFSCRGFDMGFFKDCTLYPPEDAPVTIGDIRVFDPALLDNVSAVVHLAGISNDPMKQFDPAVVYDPIRHASRALALMCKERGIKFIFASSCSVYGMAGEGVVDERSEPHPAIPYSFHKLDIERDLAELAGDGFSPIILRFATAFGLSPRMRFDIVVNMFTGMAVAQKIIVLNSPGMVWRPFVHVNDICQAIQGCLELAYDESEPLIMNVGDDNANYLIRDLAEIVQKYVPGCEIIFDLKGTDAMVRDRKVIGGVDRRDYRVSFAKIGNILKGFRCKWDVQKGVSQMRDFFMAHKLTMEQFKSIDYYRLQKMEQLLDTRQLNKSLSWRSNEKDV